MVGERGVVGLGVPVCVPLVLSCVGVEEEGFVWCVVPALLLLLLDRIGFAEVWGEL